MKTPGEKTGSLHCAVCTRSFKVFPQGLTPRHFPIGAGDAAEIRECPGSRTYPTSATTAGQPPDKRLGTINEATDEGYLAVQAICVHRCLDLNEVPREVDGRTLSLWGRVAALLSKQGGSLANLHNYPGCPIQEPL